MTLKAYSLLFYQQLDEYLALWNQGLKKIANKKLSEFMSVFDTWDDSVQEKIVFALCHQICDSENSPYSCLLSKLPYELSRRMSKILYRTCQEYGMPHLRWCYELCGHDFHILQQAYEHPQCDQKTVTHYFNVYLDDLSFGAHHFPECCLLEKTSYEAKISDCEEIIKKHEIPKDLMNEYLYYKKLYSIWWAYESSSKTVPFHQFCQQAQLEFSPIKAYYYQK